MSNTGNLEAEGLPSGSGKEARGRETPAAQGLSDLEGGSKWGVPGPGPSGTLCG